MKKINNNFVYGGGTSFTIWLVCRRVYFWKGTCQGKNNPRTSAEGQAEFCSKVILSQWWRREPSCYQQVSGLPLTGRFQVEAGLPSVRSSFGFPPLNRGGGLFQVPVGSRTLRVDGMQNKTWKTRGSGGQMKGNSVLIHTSSSLTALQSMKTPALEKDWSREK